MVRQSVVALVDRRNQDGGHLTLHASQRRLPLHERAIQGEVVTQGGRREAVNAQDVVDGAVRIRDPIVQIAHLSLGLIGKDFAYPGQSAAARSG